MKSLEQTLIEAEAEAFDGGTSGEICIGQIEDFSPSDLLDPGSNRVTVRDGKVFFVAFESDLHQYAVQKLIANAQGQEQLVLGNGFNLSSFTALRLKGAPDIYGCTAVKTRYPDLRIDIKTERDHDVVTVMAGEVTFRNGGFKKAFTVAASYLQPWSNVLYCLVMLLNESSDKSTVDSIEIILLRRRTMTQRMTGAPLPNRADCRLVPVISRSSTDLELETALQVDIVQRNEYHREDIVNPDVDFTFDIPVHDICNLAGLRRNTFPMASLTYDYRDHCRQVFQFCDDLVEAGTYPERPLALRLQIQSTNFLL